MKPAEGTWQDPQQVVSPERWQPEEWHESQEGIPSEPGSKMGWLPHRQVTSVCSPLALYGSDANLFKKELRQASAAVGQARSDN